jgi:hypothetical protein
MYENDLLSLNLYLFLVEIDLLSSFSYLPKNDFCLWNLFLLATKEPISLLKTSLEFRSGLAATLLSSRYWLLPLRELQLKLLLLLELLLRANDEMFSTRLS